MTDTRAPAGTTIRFALLVTMALAASASIYAVVLPPGVRRSLEAFETCNVRSGTYLTDAPIDVWQSAGQQAGLTRFSQCLTELVPQRLWSMIAGTAALLVVAALLYYVQPYWRIYRSRLAALDPADAADLLRALNSLAGQAGLRRPPTFLVDPVNQRVGGLAFGRGRDPYVCLDAGLITLFRRDSVSFRAVVLHELAHLRNRDVAITYLTLAVWRAFLLVALLPWVLVLLYPDGWPAGSTGLVVESGVRIAVLVLIVYLSRNAVLRSREWHADALVSRMLGTTEPSQCLPSLAGPGTRRRAFPWLTHPTPESRVAVLADRTALLRPGFWESFTAGVALQLGFIQVTMPLLTWGGAPTPVLWVLTRLWGLGLATLLLISALRAAVYRAAGGSSWWVLVLPGLGLVAGVVFGESLPVLGAGGLLPGLPAIIAGAVLAVQVVALSCWVVWLAGVIRVRPVRVRRLAWLAVGATVVGLCVSWFRWWSAPSRLEVIVELVRQTQATLLRIATVTWTGADHAVIAVVLNPIAFGFAEPDVVAMVCVALIWAVPLALGAVRAVRFAALAGALGAVAWVALELIMRAVLRGDLDAAARTTEAMIEVLTAWEIGAVVLVQLIVAAAVAARRTSATAALFAVSITGLVGSLGIWVFHAFDACVPAFRATMTVCPVPLDPGFGATVFGLVTAEGAVAAFLGIGIGYLLRTRAPMIGPARRPRRIAVTGVAVVVAASLVLLAWPRPEGSGDGPVERATAGERGAPAPDDPEALRVWLRAGGLRHLDAITEEIGGIVRAVGEDAVDLQAMRDASVRLRAATLDASRYPNPPGGKTTEAWRGGLLATGTAARMVTAAIDTENVSLLERSIPLLSLGYDRLLLLPKAVS